MNNDKGLAFQEQRIVWILSTSNDHASDLDCKNDIINGEAPLRVLAFQTARNNDVTKWEDHKVTNVRVFLNNKYYPYDNLNDKIDKDRFALLYDMYARFQISYLPLVLQQSGWFRSLTITCKIQIDGFSIFNRCSRQDGLLKCSAVDVRLELESSENFLPHSTAYCMIIHNPLVEYKPQSNSVRSLT